MKKTIYLLILLFSIKSAKTQTESFYIPTYSFANGIQIRTNGSEITPGNVGNPVGSSFFNSDDNNKIHLGQNAWFENGVKLFHVLSYVDCINGVEIYDRYNNKINSEIELATGSHEIGIVKVSCSIFHIIVGGSVYVLILEPYNADSHGYCFKAFNLEDAGTPQYIGANPNPCLRHGTNFPIAISKPSIEPLTLKKFYTIYYGAGIGTAGANPTIRGEKVYYELNDYKGIQASPHHFFPRHTQLGVLFSGAKPYGYSLETEMELSPDQTKLAIVENNALKVLNLNNGSVLEYDLGSSAFPTHYPNYGAVVCNSSNLRFQVCGIEFDQSSSKLFFSCFSMPDNIVIGGGLPLSNPIAVWDFNINTVETIPNTSSYFEPTDLEMTKGGEIIALRFGAFIKINSTPPYNSVEFAGANYTFGLSDYKTLCHLQGMSGCGTKKTYPKNRIYTLPDQIDGMDYNVFNTDECCTLPNEISDQVGEYIVNYDETWEQDDILYKDVVVRNGATLTIKNCTINFKAIAKIIVETGSKLFVDNAKLTNECNALWPGIEVRGNGAKAHTVNSQGFVQLFNNAIIEHAEQAITVMPRAIVYALSGSKILNCLNGIKFLPCSDVTDNLSYVQDVTFECNTLIPTQLTGTLKFIEFNGINWAGVYGCTFKNTLPYNILDADHRGTGVDITSSNIALHQTHNQFNAATNCFNQFGLYNTFNSLTYGVFALGSKHVVIDYANFYNCQSSVVIAATGESHVTNSIFTLDQNYIYKPRPFQDFIYLFSVNGYHVSQNTFNWHEPLSVVKGNNGVRIEEASYLLPTFSGELRNNIFTYDNSLLPVKIPDVTGIYFDTELREIKVEWNTFNALTVDWYLTKICQVQAQSGTSECSDPYNSWSQAPYTKFHIQNNGAKLNYCVRTLNPTQFNPEYPSSNLCYNLKPRIGAGNLVQNSIVCPYPSFDAGWGVNSILRAPKDNINIQPNPVSIHQPYLIYEIKHIEMVNELSIYAIDGRQIFQKCNQPSAGKINLDECNPSLGIYYLQAVTNKGVFVRKFIVN